MSWRCTLPCLLREGIPLKRGAIELLDALREADIPLAVATSASHRTADDHLSRAGILTRFAIVVSRDDCARQAHPDLFLAAASRLDVMPHVCVAVEDSFPGITAAHESGMMPIMVPDMLQPTDEIRQKLHCRSP